MSNSMSMDKIKSFIETYKEPLFNNRYMVSINPVGSTSRSALRELERLNVMAYSISIPRIDISQIEYSLGSKTIGVPSQENVDDVTITFYNTGIEYSSIMNLKKAIFNNNIVAYYNDILVNISVSIYNRAGEKIGTWVMQNCVLKDVGTIQLSYDEATEVQKFETTWSCLNLLYS